jgi:hypothetical protein
MLTQSTIQQFFKPDKNTAVTKDELSIISSTVAPPPSTTPSSSTQPLLSNPQVIQWLKGDLSFLTDKDSEDAWGRAELKKLRPDLEVNQLWSGKLGELIAKELLVYTGRTIVSHKSKEGLNPDFETGDAMWEVKTQTYFTTGTAGEKILGVPYKYRNVSTIYGKPLKILCLAGAEKECRDHYGNLEGAKMDSSSQNLLVFYKDTFKIEYIGATDLLGKELINVY